MVKLKFLKKYIALELCFTTEKNYGSMGKNYDTMEKLWYYTENYGI